MNTLGKISSSQDVPILGFNSIFDQEKTVEEDISTLDQKCAQELKVICKSSTLKSIHTSQVLYDKLVSVVHRLPRLTMNLLNAEMKKKILKKSNLEKPFNDKFKCIQTTGNGNCLYNAISIDLFGDESLSSILRYLAVHVLVNEYNYFGTLANNFEEHDLIFYVQEAATNYHWGRDLHVQALSFVLKRPIYVFQKYKSSIAQNCGLNYDPMESRDFPLYLHFSSNHWEAIIPASGNINEIVPAIRLYSSFQGANN